ncbi:transporter [Gracilibacillus boraciitolerans JCM 21714]|uniref:Transporter n=1 Tax=Gracilibacillus boraciitolerans JCM 21714 TaxID=1298598 RepID=W4VEY6_9BACI|nr:DUF4430 domain-containing protein [Gracilibacillus boraciitolerans]GAE91324.1 transporter [Gracilibacillus boraciitolerans JCM 21714]
MKKIIQFLSVIVIAIFLGACGNEEKQSTSEEVNVHVTITDQTSDSTISDENFTVQADTNLLTVLEDNYEVEVSEDGFLTAIEGHKQEVEKGVYWLYEVNGEMASVGISDYLIKDQDHITFDLEATE